MKNYLNPKVYPNMYYCLYLKGEHAGGVLQDCDWGGSCDWTAVCSCGWNGKTYSNIRRAETPQMALRELLLHAGYSPDEERRNTAQEVEKELEEASKHLETIKRITERENFLNSAFQGGNNE